MSDEGTDRMGFTEFRWRYEDGPEDEWFDATPDTTWHPPEGKAAGYFHTGYNWDRNRPKVCQVLEFGVVAVEEHIPADGDGR